MIPADARAALIEQLLQAWLLHYQEAPSSGDPEAIDSWLKKADGLWKRSRAAIYLMQPGPSPQHHLELCVAACKRLSAHQRSSLGQTPESRASIDAAWFAGFDAGRAEG